MADLARLLLLLIAAVLLVNLARGTLSQWLRAKFLGATPAAPARRGGGGTARKATA